MSFDGVFVHHLTIELKKELRATRINKVSCIDKATFILSLNNRKNLMISLNAESSHLRFTQMEYIPSTITFPLLSILKKYLESAYIIDFYQYENDRVVIFELEAVNELGFRQKLKMIVELFGRNTNLFLLDENDLIIDCYRKSFVLNENDKRIIVPKMKYQFIKDEKINPFKENVLNAENIYQGVSGLLFQEILFRNELSFLFGKTNPVIIKANNKYYFYCFNLLHLNGEEKYFPTLSILLEEYYTVIKHLNVQNAEQKHVENHIQKEITKAYNKLAKQRTEKEKATDNLKLEKIGNLLSANLYKIQKGMDQITLEDFYDNNQLITIYLNKDLSASKNLEQIFSKYKKAKRSISQIEEQIETTLADIKYLETLEEQLKISKAVDLKDIVEELSLNKQNSKPKKKAKPQLTTFHDKSNNTIYVGKNNIQNNYLTHNLATKQDYFFHVKDVPGSHTILKCEKLTDEVIKLAATIAAYYSKSRTSSNVAVDYTMVKNVKKVPKTKGSFVTYTNQKTVYVNPDLDFIKENTI